MWAKSLRSFSRKGGRAADYLFVGLGNPGSKYSDTRHNLGSKALAWLAESNGVTLRIERELCAVGVLEEDQIRAAVAIPTTFMNHSGEAVAKLVKRFGIDEPARVVVIHDELDLPVGRVKIKLGGGLAGHNGLKSVKAHLGTDDFLRVRMGVGRPPEGQRGADYVLGRPSRADRTLLDEAVISAAEACLAIVRSGASAAMNQVNRID